MKNCSKFDCLKRKRHEGNKLAASQLCSKNEFSYKCDLPDNETSTGNESHNFY